MRWLKAAAALIALTFVVAGVPYLLIRFVGNPWPAEGISATTLSDTAWIGLLACLFWPLWVQFMVCIVAEVAALARGGSITPRIRGTFGLQQNAARTLVTAIALALAATPTALHHPDHPTPGPTTAASTTELKPVAYETPQTEKPQRNAQQTTTATKQVVWKRGDTVWSIAEEHLGDGERFAEILDLNEGKTMGPGQVFDSNQRILPGWSITVPVNEPVKKPDNRETTVHVAPGENLSYIAADEYDDPNDWPTIWDANKGRRFDDGRTFTNPDLIQPGWDLRIPHPADSTHQESSEQSDPPADAPRDDQIAPSVPEPDSTVTPPESKPQTETERNTELADAAHQIDDSTNEDTVSPSWMMAGLAGAGVILAGSLWLVLRTRRRTQFRMRRPGRVIATPSPDLAPVEKAITAAAQTSTIDIEHLDVLLRHMAADRARSDQPMPSLAAIELRDDDVNLHLRGPATPPAGWTATGEGQTWTHGLRPRESDESVDQTAPWPLLVPIGHDDTGGLWLLNCEDRHIGITGDPTAAGDFVRHVAAGLACNPWSADTTVNLVGIAPEIADLSPERIWVHDSLDGPTGSMVAHALTTIDRLDDYRIDTTTARARQDDPDPWDPHLIIVGTGHDNLGLDDLTDLLDAHPAHSASAVIAVGDSEAPLGITIDSSRRLRMDQLDTELIPVGLTVDEAEGCVKLLAHADTYDDRPAPDLDGQAEWTSWSTTTGALRDDHTTGRDSDLADPESSLLPAPDPDYEQVAAVTTDDLAQLAPRVAPEVQADVQRLDPGLDADVDDWFADHCDRPRLALLGPVWVRANGTPLDRRRPYYTELVAYLATRPYGATPDEVADAFSITNSRVRTDVNKVRAWLGNDPHTGAPFVPDARHAPLAQSRGIGVYQIVGLLTDMELFRRLRIRAQARGEVGLDDLRHALRLVTGRPFDRLRPAGWTWLFDGDRLDHHITCAITDVAHLVVTHDLHAGNTPSAREVVETALRAAPDDEALRLDLAAVASAEGRDDEATRIINDDVCNRSDDGQAPLDLADRTHEVLTTSGSRQPGKSVL